MIPVRRSSHHANRRANDFAIGRWALVTISAIAVVLGVYYWYRSTAIAPRIAIRPTTIGARPVRVDASLHHIA